MEFLDGFLIVSKIFLTSHEDDRETIAEVKDFGDPLDCHCQHTCRLLTKTYANAAS